MRFDGKLEEWDEDRGSGFITPLRGGDPVSVHISAFHADRRRPRVGELLSFEVEAAAEGKRRAINVRRPGREGLRSAGTSSPRAWRAPWFSRLVTAVIIAALVVFAYVKYTEISPSDVAADKAAASSDARATGAPAEFRCDGRIHCSQMKSCDEAKFFMQNCPGVQLKASQDDVPCERQWCTPAVGK